MKTIVIAVIIALVLVAMPWGTKEANDNCLLHPIQVAAWNVFGYHPDDFYAWRDNR